MRVRAEVQACIQNPPNPCVSQDYPSLHSSMGQGSIGVMDVKKPTPSIPTPSTLPPKPRDRQRYLPACLSGHLPVSSPVVAESFYYYWIPSSTATACLLLSSILPPPRPRWRSTLGTTVVRTAQEPAVKVWEFASFFLSSSPAALDDAACLYPNNHSHAVELPPFRNSTPRKKTGERERTHIKSVRMVLLPLRRRYTSSIIIFAFLCARPCLILQQHGRRERTVSTFFPPLR